MSGKVIEKRDSRDRVRYAQPMARKRPRKLGRPPASSSVETRRRILDVARDTFADVGWEVTTNKVVAEKANVTSAAIYHYFDSKLEMYRAVYDDAESSVSTEFGAAAAMSDTFVGQFEAILERAYQMNSRDPSLARFLASARVDMKRHPELRGAIRRWAGDEIVSVLVKTGIATGEISAARKKDVSALGAGISGWTQRRGVRRSHPTTCRDRRRARPSRRQLVSIPLAERPEASIRRQEVIA